MEAGVILKHRPHGDRIQRAGSCAHAEAFQGGESHCAVNVLAVLHRAQACAASQVRNGYSFIRDLRRDFRRPRSNVLVSEAVEVVAFHTAGEPFAGQKSRCSVGNLFADIELVAWLRYF